MSLYDVLEMYVIGIIEAVIFQKHESEIFNACSDKHPTKGEYYSQMAKEFDRTVLNISPKSNNSGKIISNQKSKTKLNYQYKKPDPWLFSFQ